MQAGSTEGSNKSEPAEALRAKGIIPRNKGWLPRAKQLPEAASLPLKGSAPINLTGSERQELAAQPAERQMAAGVDGQVGRCAAGSSRRTIRPGTGADAGRLSVPREGGQGSGSAGPGWPEAEELIIPAEPNEVGLTGRGRAAERLSFPSL